MWIYPRNFIRSLYSVLGNSGFSPDCLLTISLLAALLLYRLSKQILLIQVYPPLFDKVIYPLHLEQFLVLDAGCNIFEFFIFNFLALSASTSLKDRPTTATGIVSVSLQFSWLLPSILGGVGSNVCHAIAFSSIHIV